MEYINRMAPIRKSGGICTENLRQNSGIKIFLALVFTAKWWKKGGNCTAKTRQEYGKTTKFVRQGHQEQNFREWCRPGCNIYFAFYIQRTNPIKKDDFLVFHPDSI